MTVSQAIEQTARVLKLAVRGLASTGFALALPDQKTILKDDEIISNLLDTINSVVSHFGSKKTPRNKESDSNRNI
jgi:hypothetical protein